MSTHPTTEQLELHYKRALPLEAFIRVSEHLAQCDACRQKFRTTYNIQSPDAPLTLFAPTSGEENFDHLSAEQMSAFAVGTLDEIDREIAEGHIEVCEQCALQVKERRAATDRKEGFQPSPPLSPTKRKLSFFVRLGQLHPAYAAVVIAAVAVILVAAALVWQRRQDNQIVRNIPVEPTPHVAVSPSLPAVMPEAPQPPTNTPPANIGSNQSRPAGESPPLLVALNDGGKVIGVDRQGNAVGLNDLPASVQRDVNAALRSQTISKPPALDQVERGRISLREGSREEGEPIRLTSPNGTVVMDDRPVLRWDPLPGATSYRATVLDANFNRVAQSPELSATEWRVDVPLARGAIYSWQVTTSKGGEQIKSPRPPASPVKFKVLEADKLIELERVRQFRSHLAMGLAYAQAGLVGEAEREFEALKRANPQSPVVKRLLQRVRSWRRR